jgi:hypothetical protein
MYFFGPFWMWYTALKLGQQPACWDLSNASICISRSQQLEYKNMASGEMVNYDTLHSNLVNNLLTEIYHMHVYILQDHNS